MCVDHVRELGPAANPQAANYRSDYPYDLRNGGHCETEKDLLTLPAARAQFQAQLRYIVARWGASRAVLAWEFWNEMDCMQRVTQVQCVAWTDVMARYLHGLDPYRHPITTSLGSKVVWDDLWALPSLDLVQYHDYGGRDLYAGKSQVDVYSAAMDKLKRYGKPVLFSEVGLVDNGWGPNPVVRPDASPQAVRDRKGYSFHEALWLPFFTGAASCGMHWWWDSAIEGFDWYPQYKPLVGFVADVPLHKAPLPSVQGSVSEPNLRCFARGNNWGTVAWIWNANDKWQSLVFERKAPERVHGVKLVLPEAVDGKFLVQCIDPWTGKTLLKQTIIARASTLTVPLPDFAIDIAVKAIRIGSKQVNE